MQSLSPHLRQPEDHDRLPFHPDCPVCRQTRLTGNLATSALVSVRAQAAVAAGLLALSTAGPAATAIAAEQDSEQDGTAPVTQTAPDPADNPDFDPGGAPSDLPDTTSPVPQSQAPSDAGADDDGPAAQDPTTNPSDPVVDTGDGSDPTTTTTTSPAEGQTSIPPQSGAPQPTETTTTSTPATTDPTTPQSAPTPAATPAPASDAAPSGRAVRARNRNDKTRHRTHHVLVPAHHQDVAATPAAPAVVTSATTTTPATAPARTVETHPAKPGDHHHTVQAGESLWVIANDLLGGGASTARIAREVNRLWELNHTRIGTGDPDLLLVGTRLVLA